MVTSPAAHTYTADGTYAATFTPNDGTVNGPVASASYTVAASSMPPVGDPLTLEAAILAYGAVGYWKLNETTGTTITDYSGHGRHGTVSGTPTTDYILAGTAGYLRFVTQTGKVVIPDADAFSMDGLGLTVFCVEALPGGGSSSKHLITKFGPAQQEWTVTSTFGNIGGFVYAPGSGAALAQATTNDNSNLGPAWHGVAVTLPHPSDTASPYPVAYINNNTPRGVTTGGATGSYSNGTSPVTIGAGFVGGVGHVAIFRNRLTAAHVDKLMTLARAEGLIP